MKLQLNDEKTLVDPWSHINTFEGWTVLAETIVLAPFVGNLTKVKIPPEIKPPLALHLLEDIEPN